MKKFKKLFLSLALVLVLVVPVLLSGCGVTSIGAAKIVCESANNYLETHKDYEHFENTTYKFTTKSVERGKSEYTYKERATDEETVTKMKENSSEYSFESTVSFKNLDEEDLGIYVYSVGSWVDKGYEVDAEYQTLVPVKVEGYEKAEYIVAKKQVEEDDVYYFTKVVATKEGEDDEVVSREYFEFEDRASYVEFVNQYIARSKELVLKHSYFSYYEAEMYMTLADVSESNGVVTTTMGYILPMVEYDETTDELVTYYVSYGVTSSCSATSLGEFSVRVFEGYANGGYEMTSVLNVKKSATGTYAIPEIGEGWVELEAENVSISTDYFPSAVGM